MVKYLNAEQLAKKKKEIEDAFGRGFKDLVINGLDSEGSIVWDIVCNVEPKGSPKGGPYLLGSPFEMEMIINYTGKRGSGSGIYYSLLSQMQKWGYTLNKLDEFMSVSPEFHDYYQITVAQKRNLESAIKTGLGSISQSVADFELLMHDVRRYREILDYFVAGQDKGKEKGDEHVLRQLFIDRVDAATGEGYSLLSIVKRWPTIITDFIRMKDDLSDIQKIMQELDVSQAEATVLKTKNELFKEWKRLFLPAVKERYSRMRNLADARKKSIDEYRNWLKPYIAQYKAMKEMGEVNPSYIVNNAWNTPGFGQADALTGIRVICTRPFMVNEPHRAEIVIDPKHEFIINPYDDFVKKWKLVIEYKYKIEITDNDVKELMKRSSGKAPRPNISEFPLMDRRANYYMIFDLNILLSLLKTPQFESDDLTFNPLKVYFVSHNILLLIALELDAREKAIGRYIDEMVGSATIESEIMDEVRKEFEKKKEDKKKGETIEKIKKPLKTTGRGIRKFGNMFVKQGPYEVVFFERGSKNYAPTVGGDFGKVMGFLQKKMGMP